MRRLISSVNKKFDECIDILNELDLITKKYPDWILSNKGFTTFVIRNQIRNGGWYNYTANFGDYTRDPKHYKYYNYYRG